MHDERLASDMTDNHHTQKVSPVTVEKHLKGIDFPADKNKIRSHAQEHDAPEDVIAVIERMPDREYGNAADVAKGIGQSQ